MHVPSRVIRPHGAQSASQQTEWVAKATLPTRHGNFETHIFRSARDLHGDKGDDGLSLEHVALVFGDVSDLKGRDDVLVRVHSECMTSEVFGSLVANELKKVEPALAAHLKAP